MVVANAGGDAIRRQRGLGVAAREGGFAVEDPRVVGGVVEGERGRAGEPSARASPERRGFRRQQVRGGGADMRGRARGCPRAAPRSV